MAEKECWLKTKAEISWNVRRSTQRVYCKLHFFVLHRYWQHAHLDLYWRKQNCYFRFYSCDAVYVWAFFHDVDFNSNIKKTQNWNRNASQFILSYELVNIFQSLKKSQEDGRYTKVVYHYFIYFSRTMQIWSIHIAKHARII